MGELKFQRDDAAAERLTMLRAALAHLRDGRFAATADLAQALIARRPRDVEALLLLGLALGGLGETERAALLLTRVGRERPDHAHPCRDMADLLRQLERVPEALALFRAARALEPEDARLAYAHAEFLIETGQSAAALAEAEAALRISPGFAPARRLRAVALAENGRMDEALHLFRRAVAAAPQDREARLNLAVALVNTGAFEAGLAAYNEALFHAPDDAVLHVQRAMALLKSGRLAEGFAEYEWRVRQPGHGAALPPERALPNLADIGNIGGRTILVTHDEGLGDTLQFARYAPLLAERGARVLAVVPRELARLLRGQAGFAEVLSGEAGISNSQTTWGRAVPNSQANWGAGIPACDFHCPFLSLPRVFGTTLASIPADVPYLRPDPALAAFWAERLPLRPALRVGLVWSGSPRPGNRMANLIDRRRSMRLATLAPLGGIAGVILISLQMGRAASEALSPPAGLRLHDPMAEVSDLADTAGIVANLDVVVSVDTSVAHLAGAMGKPVLLLDRYDNCWRWLTGRSDSPWYPSLRIFRQASPGDWTRPVAEMAAALGAIAAGARTTG